MGALTAAVILLIATAIPADQTSYFAATIDKHARLSQLSSPKVILVGGSNLAFSIDSIRMQEKLGAPVVNMGLHANLGLRFMLEEIKSDLKPSDIVMIVPEYQHFVTTSFDGAAKELAAVIEVYPHALRFLHTPMQFLHVAAGLPQLQASKLSLSRLIRPEPASPFYSRAAFNANGDAIGHLAMHLTDALNKPFWTSAIYNPAAARMINQFAADAALQGVKVLFIFPCLPDTIYAENQASIEEIATRLRSELTIPILGTPSLFTFPDGYFFDSVYHMTGIGRTERTERMLEQLQHPALTGLGQAAQTAH